MTAPTCPRCDRDLIPLISYARQYGVRWVPACTCFPHPPRCPFCRVAVATDNRCENIECQFVGLIIPLVERDEMWSHKLAELVRP